MIYIIVGMLVVLLGFIAWRWTSVGRGARQRDERIYKLIDPIRNKLEAGEVVTREEVHEVAQRPEVRYILFSALREMKRNELVPSDFDSPVYQAESALVYWMMHPNELQAPPDEIEFLETVDRVINGEKASFYVFKYKMPDSHWAAKDGWQLGFAGPIDETQEPYSELPGAFSRAGDIEGKVKPGELIDWYIDMLNKKGSVATE